jgi:hypothetical protein
MKKYIKYFIAVAVAVGAFGYYYVNKPKASLTNKQPDVIISPEKLLADFNADEQQANTKYLDKIIEVSGKVSAKSTDKNKKVTIMMDTGDPMSSVTCELVPGMAEKSSGFEEGSFIEVKGICTGMLADIVLVDCVILTDLTN